MKINVTTSYLQALLLVPLVRRSVEAFSRRGLQQRRFAVRQHHHARQQQHHQQGFLEPSNVIQLVSSTTTSLWAKKTQVLDPPVDEVATIQLLMSDTGGGHRASANALRDAFDVLYPGRIQCDIVDIYTDYGPFWPYNDYVNLYKFAAKYPITWDIFYHFGCTEFGLWLNELCLDIFCFEPFKRCMARPSGETDKRADMVVSVHPLCQDIPLKILADLDTNGKTRNPSERTTPFCTVVTDLGSAHPTWFNPGYVLMLLVFIYLEQVALAWLPFVVTIYLSLSLTHSSNVQSLLHYY